MTKRVLVPLAGGFEEIETVTVVDILRRAGAEVTVAGTEAGPLAGRTGIVLVPDTTLAQALAGEPFDLIAVPGGLDNTHALRENEQLLTALKKTAADGQRVAAICAAPLVLDRAGLLEGKTLTSHPGVAPELPAAGYQEERVVTCGNLVTSRAPGTAMEFAFALVHELLGEEKVREVNAAVLARL